MILELIVLKALLFLGISDFNLFFETCVIEFPVKLFIGTNELFILSIINKVGDLPEILFLLLVF